MAININENVCDESIYKSIFSNNYKLLRNYINYKFKDLDVADEYTQRALIVLWENCGKIKPIQAKKFLFTTSYRLVLNHYRREKVKFKFKENYSGESTDLKAPDLIFDENLLNNKIYSAINALPEKQKIVFMMNRFENQTYNEISEILGISVKSVEKRMQRALLNLRKALNL